MKLIPKHKQHLFIEFVLLIIKHEQQTEANSKEHKVLSSNVVLLINTYEPQIEATSKENNIRLADFSLPDQSICTSN